MKMTKIALAAVLAMGATAANAGSWYIDVAAGQSVVDLGNSPTGLIIDDKGDMYSIGGGYKFSDAIALEGGYINMGKASQTAATGYSENLYGYPLTVTSGSFSANYTADGYYFGAAFTWPVSKDFDANLRAGVLFWDFEQVVSGTGSLTYRGTTISGSTSSKYTSDGNDPYFGIGGKYKINAQTALGLDWTRYKIGENESDVDVWSANLRYNF